MKLHMMKHLRSLVLHVLVLVVRKLFTILFRKLEIVFDEDDSALWFDSDCGLIGCIFDKEVYGEKS